MLSALYLEVHRYHASQLSRFDWESPDSRQKTPSPRQTLQKPRFDEDMDKMMKTGYYVLLKYIKVME